MHFPPSFPNQRVLQALYSGEYYELCLTAEFHCDASSLEEITPWTLYSLFEGPASSPAGATRFAGGGCLAGGAGRFLFHCRPHALSLFVRSPLYTVEYSLHVFP